MATTDLFPRNRILYRLFNSSLPDKHIAPGSTEYNPFKCQRLFFGNKATEKPQLYLLWWISWYFLWNIQSSQDAMLMSNIVWIISIQKSFRILDLLIKECLVILRQLDVIPIPSAEQLRYLMLMKKTHQPKRKNISIFWLVNYQNCWRK